MITLITSCCYFGENPKNPSLHRPPHFQAWSARSGHQNPAQVADSGHGNPNLVVPQDLKLVLHDCAHTS